jgi:hypothetical protein
MPTVAQLERLQALVDRLTPLAQTRRGELIRADDWNALVGTVLEVARAVLAEDAAPATVPPHEHPDQVKIAWLDPVLRTQVERGPLADPAASARLADLERRGARLTERLDQIQVDATEVRNRVTEVTTRDLVRQSEVTSVRRTVEAINDRRDDVQALRQTLQSVERDVATAVSLGARLTVDGQPVDMAAVLQRLRGVEQVRDRLTLPTGALLDAAAVETRLTELTNTLVTQQQLDEVLRGRTGDIPQEFLDSARGSITAGVRQEMDARLDARLAEFRTETNTRLSAIDSIASRAVGDALPGVTQSTLAAVRPEIAAAAQRVAQDAQASLDRRLAETAAALRGDLTAGLDDARAGVGREVASQLDARLPAQLDAIRASVTALRDQTTALVQGLARQEAAAQTLTARIEDLARVDSAARGDLSRTLLNDVQARDTALSADVDRRLASQAQATQEQVNAAVAGLQRTLTEQVQRAAADSAAAEARNLATRLRAEMVAVAQDQTAPLQASVQSLVSAAVADAMRGVPGIVSQEVRLATANLPQLVQREFTGLQPQLQTMVQREVNERLAGRTAQPGVAIRPDVTDVAVRPGSVTAIQPGAGTVIPPGGGRIADR